MVGSRTFPTLPREPRTLVAVTALGVALAVAAQPATAQSADPRPAHAQPGADTGATARPAAGGTVTRDLTIVQLGDSYSAGNGAGADTYDTDGGPRGCYRSTQAWGARYSRWLRDAHGYGVTYVNRACSGAKTVDILEPRRMDTRDYQTLIRPGEAAAAATVVERLRLKCSANLGAEESAEIGPVRVIGALATAPCTRTVSPQINAVDHDTDLVLLTTGGNDIRFAEIVLRCFAFGVPKYLQIPTGDAAECARLTEQATANLSLVQTRLIDVFTRLRERMPAGARVVLLTYPYLSSRTHYVPPGADLVDGREFDVAEAVRTLGDRGDAMQITAARIANESFGFTEASDPATQVCPPRSPQIDPVDVPGRFVTVVGTVKCRFGGHEPDPDIVARNPDRWMNEFLDGLLDLDQNLIYHPNAAGHEQLKNLLLPFGDFGASAQSTISGTVYLDADADRRPDADERGIAGITVRLTGADAEGRAIRRETTTDASGAWTFGNLPPGVYSVGNSTSAPVRGTGTTATGAGQGSDIVLGRVGSTASGYSLPQRADEAAVLAASGAGTDDNVATVGHNTIGEPAAAGTPRTNGAEVTTGDIIPLAAAGAAATAAIPTAVIMIRRRRGAVTPQRLR